MNKRTFFINIRLAISVLVISSFSLVIYLSSQISYIIEKVQVGDLTEERINESVKRILT